MLKCDKLFNILNFICQFSIIFTVFLPEISRKERDEKVCNKRAPSNKKEFEQNNNSRRATKDNTE